jgi:hypothetical protein
MIDKKQAILTILFLLICFLLFPLYITRYEQSPIKWLFIVGAIIYFISEVGKYLSSGKEKAVNYFRVISKVGMIIAAVSVALKGLIIIKQREVYVASFHTESNEAILQGFFLLIISLMMTIFIVKYMD